MVLILWIGIVIYVGFISVYCYFGVRQIRRTRALIREIQDNTRKIEARTAAIQSHRKGR